MRHLLAFAGEGWIGRGREGTPPRVVQHGTLQWSKRSEGGGDGWAGRGGGERRGEGRVPAVQSQGLHCPGMSPTSGSQLGVTWESFNGSVPQFPCIYGRTHRGGCSEDEGMGRDGWERIGGCDLRGLGSPDCQPPEVLTPRPGAQEPAFPKDPTWRPPTPHSTK